MMRDGGSDTGLNLTEASDAVEVKMMLKLK